MTGNSLKNQSRWNSRRLEVDSLQKVWFKYFVSYSKRWLLLRSSSFSWVAVRVSLESLHSCFALTANSLIQTWPPCLRVTSSNGKTSDFIEMTSATCFYLSKNQFKFLNLFSNRREYLRSFAKRRLSIVPPSCSCKFYDFYREIFSKQSKGLCFR